MSTLTDRERRMVRWAAIGIGVYLSLFVAWHAWGFLTAKRSQYNRLIREAENLKREIQPYEAKVLLLRKLMENFRVDPARLSKSTVVAKASAAIQKTAASGGIQIGPVRETLARASERELASMQLEGFGQLPAVMSFVHRLGSLGFPLVLDAIQINSEPTKPGMVKVSLTIVILDFDQWKNGVPNA